MSSKRIFDKCWLFDNLILMSRFVCWYRCCWNVWYRCCYCWRYCNCCWRSIIFIQINVLLLIYFKNSFKSICSVSSNISRRKFTFSRFHIMMKINSTILTWCNIYMIQIFDVISCFILINDFFHNFKCFKLESNYKLKISIIQRCMT